MFDERSRNMIEERNKFPLRSLPGAGPPGCFSRHRSEPAPGRQTSTLVVVDVSAPHRHNLSACGTTSVNRKPSTKFPGLRPRGIHGSNVPVCTPFQEGPVKHRKARPSKDPPSGRPAGIGTETSVVTASLFMSLPLSLLCLQALRLGIAGDRSVLMALSLCHWSVLRPG